jgi:hypothetical protein
MSCAAAPASRATSLLLGRIAVEKGYLQPRDLDRCVREQVGDPLCRGGRFMAPLGEILVSRGYLSGAQLGEVLDEQRRRLDAPLPGEGRVEDVLFGRRVVKERLASESAVNAALRLQAVMEELGVPSVPRLGQLLVERGCLDAEDVERLLARRPPVGLS